MPIYPDKKDGKLTGRFRVEVQHAGRRMRGRFPTFEAATEAEAKWLKDLEANVAMSSKLRGQPIPMTLGALVEAASPFLFRGQASEASSLSRLRKVVEIIGPDTPPMSLTTHHVDKVVATLLDADKAPGTVNRHLSAFHSLLAWGKRRKYVNADLPSFDWQEEHEGRIRWITPEEELALYEALGASPVAVLVRVAIRTGMRRSELLGLSRQAVEPSWVRLWETKNGKPRSVPITKETYDSLMWLLDGRMPTGHVLRYAWDKAKAAMGLENDPWFVFHACRHTCATRLVQANVNLRIVQQFMGHKRIETTLRYAHVNDAMLTGALDKLSQMDSIQLLNSVERPPQVIEGSPNAPHSAIVADGGTTNA